MSDTTPAPPAAWPLVVLFTAGYVAPYLLPTVVGRLDAHLPLSPAQAGLVGTALLLGSATAGFTLASRIPRLGPRQPARLGLLLAVLGYGTAASTTLLPLVVAGVVVGGFGSGSATAVAAAGIAGHRDPHRVSSFGLLSVSATAGALYLTLPHLGGGHGLPFAAIALVAALAWPATGRLGGPTRPGPAAVRSSGRPPYPRAGAVLAGCLLFWSLTQEALWGVSGRIGAEQAGLSEATLGAVFAVALGAGLLGVTGASAFGTRLGRAVPIGAGTAAIAGCVVLTASADGLAGFAAGEILWNAVYPVVLSYLIGLAAVLDPRGRWAVFAGAASSLGTACGPVVGSLLAEAFGLPGMGLVLGGLLLAVAGPLTAVALHAGRAQAAAATAGEPVLRGEVLTPAPGPGPGTGPAADAPVRVRRTPRRILLLTPTAARTRRAAAKDRF
ncbi:MFS transporter [Streptomyces roseus]|uniref:MFS transporter n=1 Tax=Streptomyces roseus TaxID=66430 RepID=UPI0036AC84DD